MSTDTTAGARVRPPREGRSNGQWLVDGQEPLNHNEEFKAADDGLNVRARIEQIYAREGFAAIPADDLHGRLRWWGLFTQRRQGIDGGRTATGTDAVEWAQKAEGYGAAVILPTSKAGDGAKSGYDLPLIRALRESTSATIVASGGAGRLEHFAEAVEAGATVLLAASVFHFGTIGIPELKDYLRREGIEVR